MSDEHLETMIPTETGWSEVFEVTAGYWGDPYILYGIANKGVIRVVPNTNHSHIFVSPEHRGQGVCRAMKQEVWKLYPKLAFWNVVTDEMYYLDD